MSAAPGARVEIVGLTVEQSCPYCGATNAHRLSGSFQVDSSGTWRRLATALTAPDVTRQDYVDLAEVLRDAQKRGSSGASVARTVRAKVPHLTAVGDFIGSQKGDRLALWLSVVLPVLLWLITTLTPTEPPPQPASSPSVTVVVQQPSDEEVHRIIKQTLDEKQKQQPHGRRPIR